MRHLLKYEYIPFGSQYYRAPSPHPDDWERDLAKMAELGFNTVKFWVQWRWNHPEEDRFYWDDIDRLMDLAGRFKLNVMLNTIFDVAPAWIYQKYPDASMLTLDGRRIGPQTQPHRQIGGLGYCFNHPLVMEHFFHFLDRTIDRYKDHPALAIWNVGSEPELTSSMAEMRLYADNADKIGDMLCYCPYCEMNFKKWLVSKYDTIEQLNLAWNRNYTGYEQVELPKTRNTFNDMIDWRMFFVYTLGENVKRRFKIALGIDAGRHPLMCHHVFIQGFPIVSTANDPWNVGQYGDLHGFTQMDDPMMIDILRSCAKGKPVISAEMLMLFGYTLDPPVPVGAEDVKRYIFRGVAGNLKGFVFWQYRPEILGREAPAWGLTGLDGEPTPWLGAYAETGRVLQKNAGFVLDAQPAKAQIAIVYHPQNQIFAWTATGNEKDATDSLLGFHKALYEFNYNVDFIHPTEIVNGILDQYRVIIVPFPYLLGANVCQLLKTWVHRGGLLIAESHFAAWNVENGHHEKTVPGYGFHEVFKIRQRLVAPAGKQQVEMTVEMDLPFIKRGSHVYGCLVQEMWNLEGAAVLARFASGEPAVTMAEYGDGKAVAIGSYLGLALQRQGLRENASFLSSLVEKFCTIRRPASQGSGRVRVDVLSAGNDQHMVILQNLESTTITTTIEVPFIIHRPLVEQFTGKSVEVSPAAGSSTFNIHMLAGEVQVYRV
jgi:beta-galactosidase